MRSASDTVQDLAAAGVGFVLWVLLVFVGPLYSMFEVPRHTPAIWVGTNGGPPVGSLLPLQAAPAVDAGGWLLSGILGVGLVVGGACVGFLIGWFALDWEQPLGRSVFRAVAFVGVLGLLTIFLMSITLVHWWLFQVGVVLVGATGLLAVWGRTDVDGRYRFSLDAVQVAALFGLWTLFWVVPVFLADPPDVIHALPTAGGESLPASLALAVAQVRVEPWFPQSYYAATFVLGQFALVGTLVGSWRLFAWEWPSRRVVAVTGGLALLALGSQPFVVLHITATATVLPFVLLAVVCGLAEKETFPAIVPQDSTQTESDAEPVEDDDPLAEQPPAAESPEPDTAQTTSAGSTSTEPAPGPATDEERPTEGDQESEAALDAEESSDEAVAAESDERDTPEPEETTTAAGVDEADSVDDPNDLDEPAASGDPNDLDEPDDGGEAEAVELDPEGDPVEALGAADETVRAEAAERLLAQARESPEAVPVSAVVDALESEPNATVRTQLVEVLSEVATDAARDALRDARFDSDTEVSSRASELLE